MRKLINNTPIQIWTLYSLYKAPLWISLLYNVSSWTQVDGLFYNCVFHVSSFWHLSKWVAFIYVSFLDWVAFYMMQHAPEIWRVMLFQESSGALSDSWECWILHKGLAWTTFLTINWNLRATWVVDMPLRVDDIHRFTKKASTSSSIWQMNGNAFVAHYLQLFR